MQQFDQLEEKKKEKMGIGEVVMLEKRLRSSHREYDNKGRQIQEEKGWGGDGG